MERDDGDAQDRVLVSQVRDYAIFSTDVEGRATTWNEGVRFVLGYDRDEFVGSSPEAIYLPADVAAGVPARELADALHTGIADDDRWMKRKGGEAFFATGRTTRIDDAAGRCVGFTKVMRDDTERVLATDRLKLSEERYRLLFEAIEAGFCIIAMQFDASGEPVDFRYISANPAFESQTGLRNVERRSMRELAPEHEEIWYEMLGRVAMTGLSCRFECAAAALGNRWYDVYAFPIDAPELRHVAVLFSEITARKEAQIASASLASLVEHSADAILGIDTDGRIRSWNPSAQILFGYAATEVIGRGCEILAAPEHRHQVASLLQRLVSGETVRAETEAICRDGKRLPVLLTAGPVRESGRTVGISASLLDISEQRRMQAALRVEDRRKDEFLATLAHELRNPLAPLRHGLQLARILMREDGPLLQIIAMMDRQLSHLVRLVDDLLDVGRIRSGKVELRLEIVSLISVVGTSVEASQAVIDERGHRLIVRTPDEPLEVCGDAARLSQVISNLLSNSAKYMDPGGTIEVDLRRDGVNALLEVHDTGIGIAKEDLRRVFDLFSQVRAHQDHSEGGLGIGLALVRRFVELHGGTVEVNSDGSGRGSTFQVRLPLAGTDGTGSGSVLNGYRILVADDDPDTASVIARHLQSIGHDVEIALDGRQALELARRHPPDVAILDLGMGTVDGLQVARHIREMPGGHEVLLVALTGWSRESDHERSLAAGFDRHLVKPVHLAALTSLLAEREQICEQTAL